MTSAPPPDSPPTGPPSGPLATPRPSDPTQAMPQQQPPTPSGQGGTPGGPEDTSDGGGGGGGGGDDGSGAHPGGPGDHRPWWRSAPRVALIGIALVAIVALVVLLTRPDDKKPDANPTESSAARQVLLQPVAAAGPDPFTPSTAEGAAEPASPSPPPSLLSSDTDGSTAQGSAPGLYGGTFRKSSCDVERQIEYLTGDSAKARAFAGVQDIEPSEIPAYLRSLTPVQLRMDTAVTNHGFRNGKATAFQSVLQTGTAVLVGDHGEPRVRCACGNPLQPPTASTQTGTTSGQAWSSYDSSKVVTVQDAPEAVDAFALYDAQKEEWFNRPRGDTGATDSTTKRPSSVPTTQSPPPSKSPSPTHSASPAPSPSPSPTTTTPHPTTPAPTTTTPAPTTTSAPAPLPLES